MTEHAKWSERADAFLATALDELRSGVDAIPSVSAALACLRIECGEQEPDESLADIADGNAEPPCTCPPELVARGGWQSSCSFHRMR